MKPLGVAEVGDHVLAVDVGFEEAEQHPVQPGDHVGRAGMHLARGIGFQDAIAVELAAIEVRQHEPRHVGARRGQRSGGSRADDLERDRLARRLVIARGEVAAHAFRHRLAEGRILHAEWIEDVPFDIIVERLARDTLDDISGQRGAVVRISRRFARVEDAFRHPLLQQFVIWRDGIAIVTDQPFDLLFEARGVGHQLAHRHRFAIALGNREIEILVHVRVQIDAPLFDLLHHRSPGHQFGNRSGPEQRAIGIDRGPALHIREAETPLGQDVPILDHDDHRARDIAIAQRVGHEAVEPGIEIGFRQFWCAVRSATYAVGGGSFGLGCGRQIGFGRLREAAPADPE